MEDKIFQKILDKVKYSVGEHRMIFNDEGTPIDYEFVYVNDMFCSNVKLRRDQIVGNTVRELFPTTEDFWIKVYGEVVKSGKTKDFIHYSTHFETYYEVFAFKSRDNHFVSTFVELNDYENDPKSISNDRELLRTFATSNEAAFFEFDIKNKTFVYSKNLEDIIGRKDITLESYLSEFIRLTHPEDFRKVMRLNKDIMSGKTNEMTLEMRFFNEEKQEYIWMSFFAYVDKRSKHIPTSIKGIAKDITVEKELEIEQEESNQLFEQAKKVANMVTFLYFPKTETFESSKEFSEFMGFDSLITIEDYRSVIHPDDLKSVDDSREYITNITEGKVNQFRIIKNNSIRHIQSSIYGTKNNDGVAGKVFGILKDITEQVEKTEEIKFLATHDILTKVFNRNYFERYTEKIPQETEFGLVICDIDGLKLINDAFGHLEGDKLLIQFAAHLNKTFSKDIVARLGGDEFAILSFGRTEDDLEEYEKAIKTYIQNLFMFGINIDVSVGYALKCEKCTFEDSFKRAENLMYRRKLTERSSRKSKSLDTIMETLHESTEETKEHCLRVGKYAVKLLTLKGHKRLHE